MGHLGYCAACRAGLQLATRAAELRAQPAGCFARFAGGERWVPLERGAAAHWLAHELEVRAPTARPGCAAGYALHLEPFLACRRELAGVPPRPGDLWIDLDRAGCGIVSAVMPDPERGLAIAIRHLRTPPTRVCMDDFYFQLHGRGAFFR